MENREQLEYSENRITSILASGLFRIAAWVVFFAALLQRHQGLIILALLVLLLINGAKLWSKYSQVKLQGQLNADKIKLFVGEKVVVKVKVENRKLLPVWLSLKIPVAGMQDAADGAMLLTKESSLLWYEQVSWQWEMTAHRRGYHRLGSLVIRTGDLFGLFVSDQTSAGSIYLTVYPRILPVRGFAVELREFFGLQSVKSPIDDPIAPMGIRDYQYARSARHIHWKASARQNNLQEKVFATTAQVKIMLLIDVSQFTGREAEEEFERMVEIAASLAVELDRQGIPTGMLVNGLAGGAGPVVPIGKGPDQMTKMLEILARLQMDSTLTIEHILRNGPRLNGDVSCVYFSRGVDRKAENAGSLLRYDYKIPVVFVVNQTPGFSGDFKVHRLDQICLEGAWKQGA